MLKRTKLKSKCLIFVLLILFLVPNASMASSNITEANILELINSQNKIIVKDKTGIHVYHQLVNGDNEVIFVENILRRPLHCPDYEANPKSYTFTSIDYVYIPDGSGGGTWVPVEVKITVCYYCGYEISRKYMV